MRNKYAELFKDMTEQDWKILCDACLSKEGIRKYYNIDIPSNVINYYENYKLNQNYLNHLFNDIFNIFH